MHSTAVTADDDGYRLIASTSKNANCKPVNPQMRTAIVTTEMKCELDTVKMGITDVILTKFMAFIMVMADINKRFNIFRTVFDFTA